MGLFIYLMGLFIYLMGLFIYVEVYLGLQVMLTKEGISV